MLILTTHSGKIKYITESAAKTQHYIEGYDHSFIFFSPRRWAMPSKLESSFALDLKDELRGRFPGCVVIKLDPNQLQGVPDLLVLWGSYWAILETKRGARSSRQVNQEYYVNLFNEMSFSAFIHPLNCQEVLDDMERAFGL
jgi:hypothetical protein